MSLSSGVNLPLTREDLMRADLPLADPIAFEAREEVNPRSYHTVTLEGRTFPSIRALAAFSKFGVSG